MKKDKSIKNNWQKLQREFELYKIKNKDKTLKDFCNKKKLNYNYTKKYISYKEVKKKVAIYEKQKAKSFNKTIKQKATNEGKKLALAYIDKINMGDELLLIIRNSILNKIDKKEDFQNIETAIKSFEHVIKTQLDLSKIEIMNKEKADTNIDIEKEEEKFFKQLLTVGDTKENTNEPTA